LGYSIDAVGNRYRMSLSFKVPTLKMFEGNSIEIEGLDQSVYAIISRDQALFRYCLMIEYLLQDLIGVDDLAIYEAAPILAQSQTGPAKVQTVTSLLPGFVMSPRGSALGNITSYITEEFLL